MWFTSTLTIVCFSSDLALLDWSLGHTILWNSVGPKLVCSRNSSSSLTASTPHMTKGRLGKDEWQPQVCWSNEHPAQYWAFRNDRYYSDTSWIHSADWCHLFLFKFSSFWEPWHTGTMFACWSFLRTMRLKEHDLPFQRWRCALLPLGTLASWCTMTQQLSAGATSFAPETGSRVCAW